jgi:hypothetical protein
MGRTIRFWWRQIPASESAQAGTLSKGIRYGKSYFEDGNWE